MALPRAAPHQSPLAQMRSVHYMSTTDLDKLVVEHHTPSDIDSRPATPEIDVNRSHYDLTLQTHEAELKERLQRWAKVDLDTIKPAALKTLIRRGIPDELRPRVYRSVTEVDQMLGQIKALYFHALESTFGERVPTSFFRVPSFGGMFRADVHYLNDNGIETVQRLLSVIRMQNPELDYLPMLPDVIGMLLLYLNEKEVFYTVQAMLDRSRRDNWWFNVTRAAHALFMSSFTKLVEKNLPELYKHFVAVDFTIELISDEWFSHFFMHSLPFQCVLEVLDAYMNEGLKVLIRVGLALFKYFKPQLMKINDMATMLMTLKAETHKVEPVFHKILKLAYGFSLARQEYVKAFAEFRQSGELHALGADHIHKALYYRPKVNTPSSLINDLQFEVIWEWMPTSYRLMNAVLIFNSKDNGYSLQTLFNKSARAGACITLLQSTTGERFGCFTTQAWKQPGDNFCGTRECFVFTLGTRALVYKWKPWDDEAQKASEGFMLTNKKFISLGTGGEGPALWIDGDINRGSSRRSATFRNEPLVAGGEFKLASMEVYTLTEDIKEFLAGEQRAADMEKLKAERGPRPR